MATNKKLEELKGDLRILIESYFQEKTDLCYFEGYDDLPRKFERGVDEVVGNCILEVESLDNEIDDEIQGMEDEREYVEACKRRGIRPGEDI